MHKIAICDDDLKETAKISEMLARFSLSSGIMLSTTLYHSGAVLADAVEQNNFYDIILLDVVMPGINGIETADEIRHYDENAKIIFLTSSSEFAVDSYKVDAYNYLLKPVDESAFLKIFKKACEEIKSLPADSILIKSRVSSRRILLSELVYCEIVNKTMYYHLANKEVLKSTDSMHDLEGEILCCSNFVKTHRSYIVNLRYIKALTQKAVTVETSESLPLARGRYEDVKRSYLSMPFEGGSGFGNNLR